MTPEESLARAAEAGIHRLAIPTPFAVGRVNCYLIEDDPLTLVDTGPNSGKALDELQNQLAERGRSIDDLDLVILTHQHIDHLGLVEIVVEHSGAEVAALGIAAERLANFDADAEAEDRFAVELMLRNGIPEEVTAALRSVSPSFRGGGSRVDAGEAGRSQTVDEGLRHVPLRRHVELEPFRRLAPLRRHLLDRHGRVG